MVEVHPENTLLFAEANLEVTIECVAGAGKNGGGTASIELEDYPGCCGAIVRVVSENSIALQHSHSPAAIFLIVSCQHE